MTKTPTGKSNTATPPKPAVAKAVTPNKNSSTHRFQRHPNHQMVVSNEEVKVHYIQVQGEGNSKFAFAAYFLNMTKHGFGHIPLGDAKKDKLLSKDNRFIGVHSWRLDGQDNKYVLIDPSKKYATKSFLFAFETPEELQELLQMISDHYNAHAQPKYNTVYKAVPGTTHALNNNYNTLKDVLGHTLTTTIVAPWYANEIRDGSFAAIQDSVVPIYFGDDADIPSVVEALNKTIKYSDEVFGSPSSLGAMSPTSSITRKQEPITPEPPKAAACHIPKPRTQVGGKAAAAETRRRGTLLGITIPA
ncbi:hypothetical protein THAOC_08576, partial [Thalassiosira oceanica]